MPSAAASQVKMGFWIAAGFWVFGVVILVILSLGAKSLFK